MCSDNNVALGRQVEATRVCVWYRAHVRYADGGCSVGGESDTFRHSGVRQADTWVRAHPLQRWRDSVLELAKERLVPEGWDVLERKFTMPELAEAADEGRLIEAFGAGTAAVVSPVRKIGWRGREVDCGLKEGEEAGEIALRMKNWIEGIQVS